MKRMKRLIAIMVTVVMVLGMNLNVFAEIDSQSTGGTITIENPGEETNTVYHAYLMFELESYHKEKGVYSYVITDDWRGFVETGAGSKYLEIDNKKYVILKKDDEGNTITLDDTQKKALATAAMEYVEVNSIAPKAVLSDKENSYTATNLPLGYYLVDSNMGALCSLSTTDPTAVVKEKNTVPTVEKEVKEDSTNEWGESNNADIGDVVYFKTVIHAKPGAHNYILHDRMGEGLTLIKEGENAIKVETEAAELTVDEDYKIKYDHTSEADKDVVCDFEIHFEEEYLNTITEAVDITVTYAAVLNENAKIYTDRNRNSTYLQYGDVGETEADHTFTDTYKFDLVKTDANKHLLSGAKFELYRRETDGSRTKIILKDMGNGSYHVATPEQIENGTDAMITAGNVAIKGLDSGSYSLLETEAPVGYNKLTEHIDFEITNGNKEATFENSLYKEGGVQVINETGTILPETGGMGTTLFYVAGSILVAAAVVVLITRKRMNAES